MIRLLIFVNLLLVLTTVGAQKPQKSEKTKTESVTAKSDAGAKDDKAKADKDKTKPWTTWKIEINLLPPIPNNMP